MYGYLDGTIKEIDSNSIIIDVAGIGYVVSVSNPYSFKLDERYKIYIYNHIREDEYTLYGFKNKEEKELFLKLISVSGVGPKTALPMFATGSINGIVDAITRENILYLTKFPKIGEKIARQIILDLKGKLPNSNDLVNDNFNDELVSVLEGLGYKLSDIKRIIPHINKEVTLEEQIKEALKLFLK